MQLATFGGGCFWCTEAVFQTIKGVEHVTSGYMGGDLKHPTYMEICNGDTGHVEVIKIEFDEHVISYSDLLLMFFKTHNPTSLNKQGNDVGNQYKSVIFYYNEDQKLAAEKLVKELTNQQIFDKPILTHINPAMEFYEAEDYHQNYFASNPGKPYCTFVIQPKLNKFSEEFRDKIKSGQSK